MIITCKCGKEFLTEADAHVILPKPSGVEFNCGCYFTKKLKKEEESTLRRENMQLAMMEEDAQTYAKKAKEQLAKAEVIIDYYSDVDNWHYAKFDHPAVLDGIDDDTSIVGAVPGRGEEDVRSRYGGRRARKYYEEKGDKNAEIEIIIVWQNGNHKNVSRRSAWEYENDDDWLVTIDPKTLDCK